MECISRNRISYIDQLKGIAIFLVVLGHVIEHNAGRDNFLWTLIYSFHMPLFMFVSGYLAYVTFRLERLSFFNILLYVGKKCRTLLLPFLTWGILIPFFLLRNTDKSLGLYTYDYINIWGGGLWFFATLFVLSILFVIYKCMERLFPRMHMYMDILTLCLLGSILFLIYKYFTIPGMLGIFAEGLRSVISYFLFYFAGVLVGKYKWLDVFFSDRRIFSVLLFLFVVLFSLFTYDMSSVFNQAMKVVLACLAIPCMVYIVRHIVWNKRIDDIVQCFGRESLSIYVTHNGPFAFMLCLNDVLPLSDVNNLYSIFLFFLISLFISWTAIGIKKILSLSLILSFLLYGKKLYWKEI